MCNEHEAAHEHCCGHDHGLHTEDGITPAVCSVIIEDIAKEDDSIRQAAEKLEKIINSINRIAAEQGWLIGHIKAYLRSERGELWLSSVGAGIDKKTTFPGGETPVKTTKASLTAIIYGPDEETLNNILKE